MLVILTVSSMCIYCIYNSMNVCKWYMSGSATENSILLSVLLSLNKNFNQSINSRKTSQNNGMALRHHNGAYYDVRSDYNIR